jgi:hypothetical protein
MYKFYFLLLALSVFAGCAAAEIVDATAMPKGGMVRYNNGNFVREKSRLIAVEKMEQFCGGPYKIIKEEFNPDVFSIRLGGQAYSEKDNYMFIMFECTK